MGAAVQHGQAYFKLNTGALIPAVGLGTWQGSPQTDKGIVGEAVKTAIRVGYCHIDCASYYGNQKEIGNALREIFESGIVKREDLWITSKLWNTEHDNVAEAFEQVLGDLQLDYLDLYLVHWPVRLKRVAQGVKSEDVKPEHFAPLQLQETWQDMENLLETNRVRAIGVSNFSAKKIEYLLSNAKVVPAVNQVECHPVWQQKKLREYCASKGIHLSGYSPLGKWGPSVVGNPLVKQIGEKLGKTPAQVALRLGVQSGNSVLPKSTNPERLKENLDVYGWSIPEEDFKKLAEIQQERMNHGRFWVNETTSPYKTVEQLWDE